MRFAREPLISNNDPRGARKTCGRKKRKRKKNRQEHVERKDGTISERRGSVHCNVRKRQRKQPKAIEAPRSYHRYYSNHINLTNRQVSRPLPCRPQLDSDTCAADEVHTKSLGIGGPTSALLRRILCAVAAEILQIVRESDQSRNHSCATAYVLGACAHTEASVCEALYVHVPQDITVACVHDCSNQAINTYTARVYSFTLPDVQGGDNSSTIKKL